MNSERLSDVLLFVLVLVMFLSSCQSSKYYTKRLPVYSIQNVESWKIVDSLVVSNRACDRFDRGRRFVWVMMWDSIDVDTTEVYLVENRVLFDEAFGCVFLGGEPVVIQGDVVGGLVRKTETVVELKTDVFEADYPENASSWRLKYVDDKFIVTLSEPMPCWKWRNVPPDQ